MGRPSTKRKARSDEYFDKRKSLRAVPPVTTVTPEPVAPESLLVTVDLRSTSELAVEAGVSVEDQEARAKELAALVVPVTAAEPEVAPQPAAKVSYTMQLNIWGGVMALVGTAALAVAFLALNAATLGTVGLAVAAVGVACIAASVGLFSHAAKKQAVAERVHALAPEVTAGFEDGAVVPAV